MDGSEHTIGQKIFGWVILGFLVLAAMGQCTPKRELTEAERVQQDIREARRRNAEHNAERDAREAAAQRRFQAQSYANDLYNDRREAVKALKNASDGLQGALEDSREAQSELNRAVRQMR